MTYKELKERIRDLGFEDDNALSDNLELIISGVNTAINHIAQTVSPILDVYVIEQDGTAAGIQRYPMKELVKNFMGFYKKPTIEENERLVPFDDFDIEMRDRLVIKGSFSGKVNVYYKKKPTQITADTEDDFELELDESIQELVPLLAAYHIWLDDDDVKATYYYNLYETRRNELITANTPDKKLSFNGGLSWH